MKAEGASPIPVVLQERRRCIGVDELLFGRVVDLLGGSLEEAGDDGRGVDYGCLGDGHFVLGSVEGKGREEGRVMEDRGEREEGEKRVSSKKI
jgi:hypothetical protein